MCQPVGFGRGIGVGDTNQNDKAPRDAGHDFTIDSDGSASNTLDDESHGKEPPKRMPYFTPGRKM
jgi:hypothetical protein